MAGPSGVPLPQIDLARVLGSLLAHGNPVIVRLSDGIGFYNANSELQRWGRNVNPTWIHAAEVVAPAAGTALVTRAVTAGRDGYIYGFFISCQEANNFLLNWVSGAVAYSKRIVFGGAGVIQDVEMVALNEGLPADQLAAITIKNVTIAGAGMVYQANLLFAEV